MDDEAVFKVVPTKAADMLSAETMEDYLNWQAPLIQEAALQMFLYGTTPKPIPGDQ